MFQALASIESWGSLPSMIPDQDAPAHDLDIESVVNLFEILFANGTNSGSSYAPPRERLKEGLEALGIITTVLQRTLYLKALTCKV